MAQRIDHRSDVAACAITRSWPGAFVDRFDVGVEFGCEQFGNTSRGAGSRVVNDQNPATLGHAPEASYDAIVSIGAFEHFAKIGLPKAQKIEAYRRFFKWCHEHASDNCTLSLQSIVYENYDEQNPNAFVEEIFPESELPRLSEILAACEGLFEVTRIRNDRHHYARTLQVWYANLRKHRDEAIAQVGEAVYKKYEKYLGIFVVGFHTGTVNLARLTARKIASPSVAR